MIVKIWIKEGKVGAFLEEVEKLNSTRIIKKPYIPDKIPFHFHVISECIFLCELEIEETDDTLEKNLAPRYIIERILDQTGFWPIDTKHLTSGSFSLWDDLKELKAHPIVCEEISQISKGESTLEKYRQEVLPLIKSLVNIINELKRCK